MVSHIILSFSQFLVQMKAEDYWGLSYIGAPIEVEHGYSGLFEECQAVLQRNYNIQNPHQ